MKMLSSILIILCTISYYSYAQPGIPAIQDSAVALLSPISKAIPVASISKYSFEPVFASRKYKQQLDLISAFNNNASSSALQYNLTADAALFIEHYKRRNQAELTRMNSWGAYYLNSMQSILMQRGIPKQLVYLAVIETHLNVNLVSWAGAVGMWQFMAETARSCGLQVGYGVDERYDWYKSTHAAATYLNDLNRQFNDWLLVVAAYNCGPGRVHSAIKRSGSRNFWHLQYYLPLESSNHVKKFIGTQLIMEGSTTISTFTSNTSSIPSKGKAYFNPLEQGTVAIDTTHNPMLTTPLAGRYNALIIAKHILMDITSFNILNPNFAATIAKGESQYNLRLPQDKMQLFMANKLTIMNESLQLYFTLNQVPAATEADMVIPKKKNKAKRYK